MKKLWISLPLFLIFGHVLAQNETPPFKASPQSDGVVSEELSDLVGTRYSFLVHVIGPNEWPQGFYRIRNVNPSSAETIIFNIFRPCGYDCGLGSQHVSRRTELTVPAGETIHANSDHLFGYDKSRSHIDVIEEGPEGPTGTIYWGMVVSSTDVFISAYSRSRSGFISDLGSARVMYQYEDSDNPTLSGVLTEANIRDWKETFIGRVTPIGNPGSNYKSLGILRFINPYETPAPLKIRGYDDKAEASGVVECRIPAYGALSLSTVQLEQNTSDSRCSGVFGNGFGKWDIWAFSDRALATMGGLLSDDLNIISNLSGSTVPSVNQNYQNRGE